MDTLTDQHRADASAGPRTACERSAGGVGPGSELAGRYVLERELGRGGMARVYEAHDRTLQRLVAIKVVSAPSDRHDRVARLEQEARLVASLGHPNILLVHDIGSWGGVPFLVEERLEGETLRRALARGRPSPERALDLIAQAAAGLAAAHARGVVHCDLKPENLFVTKAGQVKILDFGIARLLGDDGPGRFVGTRGYASPEQHRGAPLDARSDVYSLGVVLNELLGGSSPGPDPPALARGVPRPVHRLLRRCLATDPEGRPRDGSVFLAELAAIRRRRRAARATALGALVFSAAVAAAVAVGSKAPPAPPGPFRIAVADARNATGAASLDGLADAVTRGLRATSGLQLVDRDRLAAVVKASGRTAPAVFDRDTTAFVARQVGAAALLLPSAVRRGDGFVLALQAREPESGRVFFSLEEAAPDERGLPEATRRLVRRAAAALLEREAVVRSPDREVARALSASLEANQRYLEGLRCVDRPSTEASSASGGCERYFHEALAVDPEFPLAWFELVRHARWQAHTNAQLRELLSRALRHVDRLPAREQAQLKAWEAELDGQLDRAAALLQAAARDYPQDARLALGLGELHYREGRHAEAIAPFEQAVRLEPGLERAVGMLVWSLGMLDRTERLASLAETLARSAPTAATLRAESRARGWTGDAEGALRVARRAAPGGAGAGRDDLEDALVAAERYDEAEALLREDARAGSTAGAARLRALLRLRGRWREADALQPAPPETDERLRFVADAQRAYRLAAVKDAAAIGRIADRIRGHSAELAATLAPLLAYVGDTSRAVALAQAPALHEGAGGHAMLAALLDWRRRGAAAALPALRGLATAQPVAAAGVFPPEAPRWLAAECAADVAAPAEALVDLRRFQRFYYPLGPWRAWAWPKGLLLEARLLASLGRTAEANAALARLDSLLAGADADLPLHAERRALGRDLAARPRDTSGPDGRGR